MGLFFHEFFMSLAENPKTSFDENYFIVFQAMISLVKSMRVNALSLISSDHEASKVFVAEATTMGIRVPRILELGPDQKDLPLQVEQFVQHLHEGNPAIALLVSSNEAIAIAEHLRGVKMSTQPLWIVGSLGLDLKKESSWRNVFSGGIFVEPHMPELKEFKKYFLESLKVMFIWFYQSLTLQRLLLFFLF